VAHKHCQLGGCPPEQTLLTTHLNPEPHLVLGASPLQTLSLQGPQSTSTVGEPAGVRPGISARERVSLQTSDAAGVTAAVELVAGALAAGAGSEALAKDPRNRSARAKSKVALVFI
jgi:hypothetical protein